MQRAFDATCVDKSATQLARGVWASVLQREDTLCEPYYADRLPIQDEARADICFELGELTSTLQRH
jgi:hypothetical protein